MTEPVCTCGGVNVSAPERGIKHRIWHYSDCAMARQLLAGFASTMAGHREENSAVREVRVDNIEQALAYVGAPRPVRRAFELMRIAEVEIEARYPKRPQQPEGIFVALCPPRGFDEYADALYRAHAREMVARDPKDWPDPTEAECLVAIMAASLKAPLTSGGQMFAERLYVRVMDPVFETDAQEDWPHQFDEMLFEAKRKLRGRR